MNVYGAIIRFTKLLSAKIPHNESQPEVSRSDINELSHLQRKRDKFGAIIKNTYIFCNVSSG